MKLYFKLALVYFPIAVLIVFASREDGLGRLIAVWDATLNIVPSLGNNKDFYRLRIGIGHPGHASRVTGYVLGAPSQVDRTRIDASIEEAIAALPLLLGGDEVKAMTRLHSFSAA